MKKFLLPLVAVVSFAACTNNQNEMGAHQKIIDSLNAIITMDHSSEAAAVMKADNRLMKTELDFIRQFFTRQFGAEITKQRMILLREILGKLPDEDQLALVIREQGIGHVSPRAREGWCAPW